MDPQVETANLTTEGLFYDNNTDATGPYGPDHGFGLTCSSN